MTHFAICWGLYDSDSRLRGSARLTPAPHAPSIRPQTVHLIIALKLAREETMCEYLLAVGGSVRSGGSVRGFCLSVPLPCPFSSCFLSASRRIKMTVKPERIVSIEIRSLYDWCDVQSKNKKNLYSSCKNSNFFTKSYIPNISMSSIHNTTLI